MCARQVAGARLPGVEEVVDRRPDLGLDRRGVSMKISWRAPGSVTSAPCFIWPILGADHARRRRRSRRCRGRSAPAGCGSGRDVEPRHFLERGAGPLHARAAEREFGVGGDLARRTRRSARGRRSARWPRRRPRAGSAGRRRRASAAMAEAEHARRAASPWRSARASPRASAGATSARRRSRWRNRRLRAACAGRCSRPSNARRDGAGRGRSRDRGMLEQRRDVVLVVAEVLDMAEVAARWRGAVGQALAAPVEHARPTGRGSRSRPTTRPYFSMYSVRPGNTIAVPRVAAVPDRRRAAAGRPAASSQKAARALGRVGDVGVERRFVGHPSRLPSFIARPMSPSTLSRPLMKAEVGFDVAREHALEGRRRRRSARSRRRRRRRGRRPRRCAPRLRPR